MILACAAFLPKIGELQLELVQQCSAIGGLSELLVPQLLDREFELLDRRCPRLRLRLGGQAGMLARRAASPSASPNRPGKGIIGTHHRPENYSTLSLSRTVDHGIDSNPSERSAGRLRAPHVLRHPPVNPLKLEHREIPIRVMMT